MRAVQPSGPYYLGGYCFGGTVAFEIAQQLHAAGERVDLLLLLDTSVTGRRPGPKSRGGLLAAVHVLRSRKRPVHLWQRIGARSSERASAARDRLSRHRRALGGVSRQERAAYLLAKLQQHLGWQAGNMAYRLYRRCRTLLPRACGTAIRDRLWRWTALDVFLDARSEYVLRRSPSRLTLFRTHEPNARHTIDELRTHWQQFSPYPVEIHVIPGDHVSMFEEPHVQVLAATLLDCLRRAQSQPGEAKNA
jgi:thioesterase domain-containing protein